MKILKSYFWLTRPHNCAIGFLSVFIGGLITGTVHPLFKLLMACFSGMCIAAGANAVNDYFDIEIDRINKPKRPLPSGMLRPGQAYRFSILCFLLGILLSLFIHLPGFLIASGSSVLLYLYSSHLKRTVVWGNLTVALITGLAFVYGGLAVGRIRQALVAGVFAFLFDWAREMIKDAEDVVGDRSQGIQTLPIRHGIKVTLVLSAAVLALLIVLTFVPFFTGMFSLAYLIAVVAAVDLVLVYVITSMFRNPDSKNLGRLAVVMKWDMLGGLLAMFIGSFS